MKNYIIKFKFTTPVHFGTLEQRSDLGNTDFVMQNDSIFSAICIQANKMYGQSGIDKLVDMCNNNFAISSMMPYVSETYFLPKPLIVYNLNDNIKNEKDKYYGKKLKNLKYIPISQFDDFNYKLKNNIEIDIKSIYDKIEHIGNYDTIQKVRVSRIEEDSEPYHIGIFNFEKNSGTYILLQIDDNDLTFLTKILYSLSYDGFGGRKSNGYGKFTFEIFDLEKSQNNDLKNLSDMLKRKSEKYMTLSLFLPKESNESTLDENSFFTISRRSGFVSSEQYNENLVKKSDIYALNVGSTFSHKLNGQLKDVSTNIGTHSVYKLLKPIFLGVE